MRVLPHRYGDDLHVRLVGTPGARAFVRVPGLFRAMALEEVRPGVYEAHRALHPHEGAAAAVRAVGILDNGAQRVIARAVIDGGRNGRRDHRAPEIAEITPVQGERVSERGRTRITARVADDRSGVESVRLRVDGLDVSDRVRFDGDEVRYAENLRPGQHTAELQVRDRAGNVARRSWSFDVVEREHRGGHGWGRVAEHRW